MATDIVPELWNKIKTEFNELIASDEKILSFQKKLEKEEASGEDVSLYAVDLGGCAAKALLDNFTEDILPDGRLYWNIADRTIKPLLKEVYDFVMMAATRQQEYTNKRDGIGLKPAKSRFPEERINDLMFKLVSIFDEVQDE